MPSESSAAQGRPKSLGEATGPTGRGEAGGQKPSAAQGRDLDVQLEMELELRRLLITAERALHEIAENTARASNQHRARALLALEEIEERHAE